MIQCEACRGRLHGSHSGLVFDLSVIICGLCGYTTDLMHGPHTVP